MGRRSCPSADTLEALATIAAGLVTSRSAHPVCSRYCPHVRSAVSTCSTDKFSAMCIADWIMLVRVTLEGCWSDDGAAGSPFVIGNAGADVNTSGTSQRVAIICAAVRFLFPSRVAVTTARRSRERSPGSLPKGDISYSVTQSRCSQHANLASTRRAATRLHIGRSVMYSCPSSLANHAASVATRCMKVSPDNPPKLFTALLALTGFSDSL